MHWGLMLLESESGKVKSEHGELGAFGTDESNTAPSSKVREDGMK